YKNEIDFRDRVHFPSDATVALPELHGTSTPHLDPLVPLGGGKDSVVTGELLKKASIPFTLFSTSQAQPVVQTAKLLDAPILFAERRLDPQLFELNTKPGVYNGHVPITGYLYFVALLVAILHKKTDVVWSLESSAEEATVDYLGMKINHQFSKTLRFERAFQQYCKTFVTKNVRSFSLLRPFSELQIVKQFVQFPEYFSHFGSCNRNFTQKKPARHEGTFWCGACAKCAFIFVSLCAFLPHNDVVNIFANDLFASETLLPTLKELLGLQEHKPFDCVGTIEETRAAMELAMHRGDARDTRWMQTYVAEVRDTVKDHDALIHKALTPSKEHAIPQEYQPVLEHMNA
ncbi:hypothetical protein HYV72_02745, partial [Candidatus Uhrbacteria bacterium]|nr:hypothetical protein [Candidatus Uhrbacteria bacterium]